MKICFITTVDHNVGDDFVREGIAYLVERVYGQCQWDLIHKHIPLTARPEWDWFYRRGIANACDHIPKLGALRVSNLIDLLPLNTRNDKILNCDLLIQSGAPIYWLNDYGSCANNEWFKPLVKRRWEKVKDRVPFFNIAGGTCQSYYSDGSEFERSAKTLEYIRAFFDFCQITTLRDHLSNVILNMAGRSAPVLPCTSIFARKRFGIEPDAPSFVALNYMSGAGHYDLGQNIDVEKWENTFKRFATQLAKHERCVVVCHNGRELIEAKKLLPGFETFYSPHYLDYLRLYSRAKCGVFNRVHGAFVVGSFGRPAVVIGADSRARMAELIGIESYFANEVTCELLQSSVENMIHGRIAFQHCMDELQIRMEKEYLGLIETATRIAESHRVNQGLRG